MLKIKPVLIVGSGPTGLILAAELTRRNVPCRIIDRKERPTISSRAFTIHARTLEIFETMGIVDRYLDTGIKSFGFLFNFEGLEKKPVLDFRILRSRYPYILLYSQAETERLLREHLQNDHGVTIEWNTELSSLSKNENGAMDVQIKNHASGNITAMDPSYVIGCDGVHSFVRKSMSLSFDGETYEGMIMQMMDASTEGYQCDPDWIQYFMQDQNFLLTTPLPNGKHRILISDMGETAITEGTRVEAYQQVIDGHGAGFTLVEPEWITQWVIWKRLANIYREGDVFLCGDSAHVHSPSGGQGMNSCIQDAWNLAWKLAMVLRGEAKADLLDTYEVERKPIAQQVIDGTDAMHDIIMAHGRGMAERMELTETPGWQTSVTELVAGISYTYRDHMESIAGLSPLEGGPEAGDRAPDVALSGNRRLFSSFGHTGYTLVLMPGDNDSAAATRIADQVITRYGTIIKAELIGADSAASVADVYGHSAGGRLYLVRPDGYIAFRSSIADGDSFFRYLSDHLIVQQ